MTQPNALRNKIAVTFGLRLLGSALSMVTGVMIARLLGPEGRGEYFLAISIIGMAQQFGTLGLHSSNVYQVAARRELFPQLAVNSSIVSLVFAILLAPPLLVLLPNRFPAIDLSMAALIALAIGPSIYYLLVSNLLLGVDRVAVFNRCELLSRALPLLFVCALFFVGGLSAHTVVMASLLAMIASAMAIGWVAQPRRRPRADLSLLRAGMRYGARAYLAALMGFMLSRVGGVVLGAHEMTADVGQLSIALQLSDFMIMLPATVGLILFPRLVGNSNDRGKLTFKAAKIVAVIMAAACAVAGWLADPLIPLVFGDSFSDSVPVFRLMLPGIFALSLISVVSQYLAAHGIPWLLVVVWCGGLMAMLLLSWLLVPSYGARAVAIAMSAAYVGVLALLGLMAVRWEDGGLGKQ